MDPRDWEFKFNLLPLLLSEEDEAAAAVYGEAAGICAASDEIWVQPIVKIAAAATNLGYGHVQINEKL